MMAAVRFLLTLIIVLCVAAPAPAQDEPPAQEQPAADVEFTAEGERALVSIWHPQGAVVVYDSRSLKEVDRLPYAMPVGKYNARNKTRLLR